MVRKNGFTLLELIVVIAIIGILAVIVLVALDESRMRGKDSARKIEIQEVIKALELYYSDGGLYPLYGGVAGTGGFLSGIQNDFYGSEPGKYLKRLPVEAATHFYYCVSPDRKSMLIGLDTENDKGGTNFCHTTRGPGPNYGCNAWQATNSDQCAERIN